MKMSGIDYLLYAVTDFEQFPAADPVAVCRGALAGGATVLQLRDKHGSRAERIALAVKLQKLCREYHACFIVNDDVEAALAADADGVHVGQHDLSLAEARRILGPEKIIGVSVQMPEQARLAIAGGADYLGSGAVFPTRTKPDADDVSLNTFREICRLSAIPVVAIGGVGMHNIPLLAGSGAAGIAVVSALFGAPDVRQAAAGLRRLAEKTLQGKHSL